MWLVLCHASDLSALWAYQGLKARGLEPLELVSAESLACALRWEHWIEKDGTRVEIQLADGRIIRSEELRGVINRLLFVPIEHWRSANAADQEYVQQELTAFYMSWLFALTCPVINRPTPLGLAGKWHPMSEWIWLAARAGLPTPSHQQSSLDAVSGQTTQQEGVTPSPERRTVMIVAGKVVGALTSPEIAAGCLRLCELSGTELLGIEFCLNAEGAWSFASATATPDLRIGGSAILDALKCALTDRL